MTDLGERGFRVWVDYGRLSPGTSWERELKRAIECSYALLVLASPNCSDSTNVMAEVALAKSLSIPVIPVWVSGDHWAQCIPLDVFHTQYIDVRHESYQSGIGNLCDRLSEIAYERRPRHRLFTYNYFDKTIAYGSPSYITILLEEEPHFNSPEKDEEHHAVVADPERYSSLQSLLDDLFLNYLGHLYPPFSYGSSWLLRAEISTGHGPDLLIASWEWFASGHSAPISRLEAHWTAQPLSHYGIQAGGVLTVLRPNESDDFEFGAGPADGFWPRYQQLGPNQ